MSVNAVFYVWTKPDDVHNFNGKTLRVIRVRKARKGWKVQLIKTEVKP